MVQEYKNAGIAGAGASGCTCAYFLLKAGIDVTLFDFGTPLRTLLPTGGGRCNLGHADYEIKELAKNYPRGEKFLYSVFSKFSTYDTLSLFEDLGINTYIQDDGRIFPSSNSSKDVREKIINKLKNLGANFVQEKVISVNVHEGGYKLTTNKAEYLFTDVVISTGGKTKIEGINHKVIPFTPSLVGLNSNTNKDLSGVVVKNVFSNDLKLSGDILFTHFGISGPLIYKISSVKTKDKYPYTLSFDLCQDLDNLQELLNSNPHKELKNIISKYMPEKLAVSILGEYSIQKGHTVNGKMRDEILSKIHNYTVEVTGTNKGEETVTAGGYDLGEINSKTMESKIYPNLYFTGEVLNIDGFCGGYNLQNAWSTAFVASEGIINKVNHKSV